MAQRLTSGLPRTLGKNAVFLSFPPPARSTPPVHCQSVPLLPTLVPAISFCLFDRRTLATTSKSTAGTTHRPFDEQYLQLISPLDGCSMPRGAWFSFRRPATSFATRDFPLDFSRRQRTRRWSSKSSEFFPFFFLSFFFFLINWVFISFGFFREICLLCGSFRFFFAGNSTIFGRIRRSESSSLFLINEFFLPIF